VAFNKQGAFSKHVADLRSRTIFLGLLFRMSRPRAADPGFSTPVIS
jgi:hypothetical protein